MADTLFPGPGVMDPLPHRRGVYIFTRVPRFTQPKLSTWKMSREVKTASVILTTSPTGCLLFYKNIDANTREGKGSFRWCVTSDFRVPLPFCVYPRTEKNRFISYKSGRILVHKPAVSSGGSACDVPIIPGDHLRKWTV